MSGNTREVTIPACQEHAGVKSVTVTLNWVCPQCGEPRGEPFAGFSYDGSRRLSCHQWTNPCGHVDRYIDVRREVLAQQPAQGEG